MALFILITFLSNPKKEDHKESFRIKLSGIIEEILSENKNDNVFVLGLSKVLADKIIDEVLKNVSVDNYLFFSLTKLNWASDSKIIGFGVFGKVYISNEFDKEQVENYIGQIKNKFDF